MTIENLIQDPQYKEKFVLQKLICYFLDYSKEEMRINARQELSSEQEKKILDTYRDISENQKPLEYALWFVEFFKRKFHVNENTLIPRPETEYMVLAVTEEIDEMRKKKWETGETAICKLSDDRIRNQNSTFCLLDIGTWCGVLGISILLQNPCFFRRAIFTDISPKALSVAQLNYEIQIKDHDFPIEFIKSDLLDFCEDIKFQKEACDIILVGNLPYIPEKTFDENVADNVKKWEPRMAFVAGDDWLIYYRKLLDQILHNMEDLGLSLWACEEYILHNTQNDKQNSSIILFLEMMTWQTDILRQEYNDHFIFEEVKTFHFNIRIIKATLRS